jgi:hypothetical protein
MGSNATSDTLPVILALSFLFFLGWYIFNKNKKQKHEVERIKSLSTEDKKIYLMKAQMNLDKYKTNHILHFIVSILCIGVWIIISHNNTVKRREIEKLIEEI